MDYGSHPICNRFLKARDGEDQLYPLQLGQCGSCGLIQLLDPVPAQELVPAVDWITYNEPERHLDAVAETLASLPGLGAGAVIGGISFKDDTLLARMARRGFTTWRLDMAEDLGLPARGLGVESIQATLTPRCAEDIASRRGKAELVIARHILEHAQDMQGFLRAVQALAKPDGYVMFEVPDCALALENKDITTLWEEHTVYFTPASLRTAVTSGGRRLARYECHAYPFENCLVAITKGPPDAPPERLTPESLAPEMARGCGFATSFPERRKSIQSLLKDFHSTKGKIALFGAGHLACTWVHLYEVREYIEFVADDNPHKQNLFMPGSRLPIRGSNALVRDNIKLALLGANPDAEPKIISKNSSFVEHGGIFASIFPSSQRSLANVLDV